MNRFVCVILRPASSISCETLDLKDKKAIEMRFHIKNIVVLGSLFSMLIMISASVVYFFDESFRDHVEASVASISVAWHHGYEIYPQDQSMRSLLYGPLVFLLNSSFFSLLGAVGLKLSGVLAFLSAVFVVIRMVQNETDSLFFSVVLAAWFFSILFLYRETVFWNRPDPLIFLVVASYLAAFALLLHTRTIFFISTILSVGIIANLKIHAVFYILPLFLYWLRFVEINYWEYFSKLFLGILSVFAVPFMFSGVSFLGYLDVLQGAAKHGIEMSLVLDNAKKILYLFVPVFLSFLYRPKENKNKLFLFARENKIVVIGACISFLVVSILAGKKGAGAWHMMPFAPYFILVAAKFAGNAESIPFDKNRLLTVIASFLFLLYFSKGVSRGLEIIEDSGIVRGGAPVSSELQSLRDRYGNQQVHMGFAGDNTYNLTFHRWRLIGIGSPLLMDPASLMDLKVAGVNVDREVLDLLSSGKIALWIIPKREEPFSLMDAYNKDELLLSLDTRKNFIDNFKLIGQSENFSVWSYNSEH